MTVTDIPSGSDAVMFDTERLWCVCQSIGVDRPGFDLLVSLMDTGRAYVQPWLECDVVTWAAVAADAIAPLVDVSCLDKHTFHASRNVIVRALFDRWFVHGEQPSKHAAAALTPPTMSSVLGELDGILQVPDSLALAARMGTWMHRCARVESISLRGRGAWAFLDALHSNRDAYQTSGQQSASIPTTLCLSGGALLFAPKISRASHLKSVQIDEIYTEDVENTMLELCKLEHLQTLFVGCVCAPHTSRRRLLGAGKRDMALRQWAPLGRLAQVTTLTLGILNKLEARSVSGLARAVSSLRNLRKLHLLDFGNNSVPVQFHCLTGITSLEVATDDVDGIQDLISLRALTAVVPSSRPFVGDHVFAALAQMQSLQSLELLMSPVAWPRLGSLGHMTALTQLVTAVLPRDRSLPRDVCHGPRSNFLLRALASRPPPQLKELTIGACALVGGLFKMGGWHAVAQNLSIIQTCVWAVRTDGYVRIPADEGTDAMTASLSQLRL